MAPRLGLFLAVCKQALKVLLPGPPFTQGVSQTHGRPCAAPGDSFQGLQVGGDRCPCPQQREPIPTGKSAGGHLGLAPRAAGPPVCPSTPLRGRCSPHCTTGQLALRPHLWGPFPFWPYVTSTRPTTRSPSCPRHLSPGAPAQHHSCPAPDSALPGCCLAWSPELPPPPSWGRPLDGFFCPHACEMVTQASGDPHILPWHVGQDKGSGEF